MNAQKSNHSTMSAAQILVRGGPIFDGERLLQEHSAVFTEGHCSDLLPNSHKVCADRVIDLHGDILSPGFTDLQVNGGGGILFNDQPSVDTLSTIAQAHRSLGTRCLLPTLITDTPTTTRAAINAATEAIAANVTSISGLHLEGPHLSVAKKGAHDAALIRPMLDEDLEALLHAASNLPMLKITIAPENVTLEQVSALVDAGARVALGHTNASFDTCLEYYQAGASCVTHLFNAMSQFGSRDPGVVGSVFESPNVYAGLIADGVHVHAATVRAALRALGGMQRLYLVTDAMAVAGTQLTSFTLNARTIHRKNGRLTLEDKTLAGADLDMITAIRFMVDVVDVTLEEALRAAVSIPYKLLSKQTSNLHSKPMSHTELKGMPAADCIRIPPHLKSVTWLIDS